MRRALALVLALAAVLAVPPAGAWTFYYHLFGDWRLVCWRSAQTSDDPLCTLTAPPDELATGARNVLHVEELRANVFRVWIEIRDRTQPGVPSFLRIGAFPVHEARPVRGAASWTGAEAMRIVGEMRAAPALVFRVQTAPDGLPRDTAVGLGPFREALAAYRTALRRYGVLGRPPSRNPL